MNSSIYLMIVDLNVLKYLSINPCSNIAATLTKFVTNAWAANDSGVQMTLPAY